MNEIIRQREKTCSWLVFVSEDVFVASARAENKLP